MVGWTKGPKCEVQGCPSRLWTVIDGRNVCKNGHVSDSALVVSDDEELRGFKRAKITQTQQSQLQDPSKLAGQSLLKVQATALALLLREQNVVLRNLFNIPMNVEHTARILFIRFANTTALSIEGKSKRILSIGDTICILWLSLALNGVPIYMMDLMRLVRSGQLPFKCPFAFAGQSKEFKAAWEAAQFTVFNFAIPESQTLWKNCVLVCKNLGITIPKRPVAPLVYKLLRDLMLPITLYPVATTVAEILVEREIINRGTYMERSCLQAVVISLKALYKLGDVPILDAPDWKMWSDMMLKVWVYDDIVEEMDTKNIAFCDQDTIDRVLSIYQKESALPSLKLPQVMQQLFKMFPVPQIPDQDENYDLDVHKELIMALYNEVESLGEPLGDIARDYVTYSRDVTSQWILPPIMEILFQICSRFLLVTPDTFRQELHAAELYISLTACRDARFTQTAKLNRAKQNIYSVI